MRRSYVPSMSAGRLFGMVTLAWFGIGLLVASSSQAAAPELKWKFTQGESIRYAMNQKTVTEFVNNTQNIKTTVNQTIEMTWAVKSVSPEGIADMAQTIDRLKTRVESPFGAFEYDSQDEKKPEGPIAAQVVPMVKTLVGATFRFKMSPRGELSDVQVPDSLIKSLKEASQNNSNVGMFSEDGLKNMIHESSLVIPADALDKAWTRQTKIPAPPIGTMVLDKTYKYEGPEKNTEKISLNINISLTPDPDAKFDIKVGEQNGKGEFFFDSKAGRVVESSVREKVEMKINIMNMATRQITDTTTEMKLIAPEGAK